ncbi:MAG: hypothetical protein A2521_06370 [Deltaproteobacteria bacterium RIFOXYD12_FULL_57_12]|nr:MAG: hypothetical protein A2521_06370 [Deltaproteobacteria bacterium RIFOXYD12_FULL_57_12]
MALMQLTVIPLGTGSSGLSDVVAEIQSELARQGFFYVLNDMGTTIEGESEALLALAGRLAEIPFKRGAMRVVTQITIDDRRDKQVRLGDKTASVLARQRNIDGCGRIATDEV